MNMTTRMSALAVTAGLALGVAQAAHAVTVLTFAGHVTTVDAALTGAFSPGASVSITLTYDPLAPAVPGSSSSNSAYPYISFDLQFGSYHASFAPQPLNSIVVLNNTDQGLGPADAFGASATRPSNGDSVGGLPLQQGFVSLWDLTETAFSQASLPQAPTFSAFGLRVAGLSFCAVPSCGSNSNPSQVSADIDSMAAVTAVPEPATVALLLSGLGMVVGVGRRRVGGGRVC
jgi:PEP-CTERM motif